MPRKIRDHDDALACLDAWEASDQPLATWARAHGVDARSLNCWKLNLGGQPKSTRGLVELVPTGVTERAAARYTIRFEVSTH